MALSPALLLLGIFLISTVAGTLGAILGLGGGIIIVPVLTIGLGVPIQYAVGASIISVIATSSGAAATYVRDHISNIRVAMLLEVATSAGALGGAFLSTLLPARFLFGLFSLLMVYSAAIMLRKRSSETIPPEDSDSLAILLNLPSSYPDPQLKRVVHYGVQRVPFAFIVMIGAGVLSALLGIGSGSLKVPAMDAAMRLPIKVSTATSNFMMGVTAAASAGAYYMRGEIPPRLAAPVALGVLLGSWFGVKLMLRMKGALIRKIFVVVLLVTAVEMALKAFGMRGG